MEVCFCIECKHTLSTLGANSANLTKKGSSLILHSLKWNKMMFIFLGNIFMYIWNEFQICRFDWAHLWVSLAIVASIRRHLLTSAPSQAPLIRDGRCEMFMVATNICIHQNLPPLEHRDQPLAIWASHRAWSDSITLISAFIYWFDTFKNVCEVQYFTCCHRQCYHVSGAGFTATVVLLLTQLSAKFFTA